MKKAAYIWATFFGSGYFPIAPGTIGSLAAVPFVWYCAILGPLYLAAFVVFTFITGVLASHIVSEDLCNGDPQIVVIDEVHGQGLALLLVPSHLLDPTTIGAWAIMALAFIFFRFFDVKKPFPVSYFDQQLHGGWGMMLDDTFAGLYAMIATYLSVLLIF